MKKSGVLIVLLLLASLFLVSCAEGKEISIQSVFESIVSLGKLEFLGGNVNTFVGFMRVMVGILVFALFYMGVSLIPGMGQNRNIAITVAVVLAIIATIFIPGPVLAGIGTAYGTLVALILIGVPVAAGGALLYVIPSTNRWLIAGKMVIIILMIWLLRVIVLHAKILSGAV